jgi:cytochrome c553
VSHTCPISVPTPSAGIQRALLASITQRVLTAGILTLALVVACGIALGQTSGTADDRASDQAQVSPNSAIVLPIEVLGSDGTTATVLFNVPDTPNLKKRQKLWMEIHALRYETEASLQLNGGPWIPINNRTASVLGLGASFGGIGGEFATLKMTMNLRIDDVRPGTNTLAFRFNGTDGIRSGFRVLNFNIVASGSERLIPQTSFVQDDPSKWQPPSTTPADIEAGKSLWTTAALTSPGVGALKARCGSCHTDDGRDLKYFNYSNRSIRARSMFHGLSEKQGDQIASYIRSLKTPSPGRPWNPPYQPGPGLDSQPVANWAAGAGIEAVLETDTDMLPYIAPKDSTLGWSASSYFNARETPIALQFPDWNSWLPTVHPLDGFGDTFTASKLNRLLPGIRTTLQPHSPAAYRSALEQFNSWGAAWMEFMVPATTNVTWNANQRREAYSIALWQLVKNWGLIQEFGLEGMPQVPFGAKAAARGWYTGTFYVSPNNLHIPAGPGLGNGTPLDRDYLSLAWYQMQLTLNDGQGSQSGHEPVDYGYGSGFIMRIFARTLHLPGIMLQLEWNIKALQEVTLTGAGPEHGALGWHATQTSMATLVMPEYLRLWSGISPAKRTTLLQAYTEAWFAQASKYTPLQYYQGGWANASDDPAKIFIGTMAGQLWYTIPKLRELGVDSNLMDKMAAWAATIWPRGNWTGYSATCLECRSAH